MKNRATEQTFLRISVIVATINRPGLLRSCIRALLRNSYPAFELIIIDQTRHPQLPKNGLIWKDGRVHYHTLDTIGKSHALNIGVQHAKGEIVAFTDDDCIVSSHWLQSISDWFANNPKAAGVCGRALPYRPSSHKHFLCPVTFGDQANDHQSAIITHDHLGIGNNFAIRKSALVRLGLFASWLGPGVNGMNGGEDWDMMYRALRNKNIIGYSSSITIFHNKWVNVENERRLQCQFTKSITAFAGYHLFRFDLRPTRYIKERVLRYILDPWIHAIRLLRKGKLRAIGDLQQPLLFTFYHAFSIMGGLIVAAKQRLAEIVVAR